MPSEVNRDDSTRAWGNGLFDRLRRKIKGVGIDIGENRDSVARQYRGGRGDESNGWNDPFISTLDANSSQCGFQGDCPINGSDGMLNSIQVGEGRFKFLNLLTVTTPGTTVKNFQERLLLFFSVNRLWPERPLTYGLSAEKS